MIARRLVAVGIVLALTGCSFASGGPPGPKVAVIGDSITYLSTDDIGAALVDAHFHPLITGRIGYTAEQLKADVAAYAEQRPAIVVLEVGTNDVTLVSGGHATVASFEQSMLTYLGEFPDACVIATTVSSHRTAAMDPIARDINDWLRANFAHVIDWDSYEWAKRQQHVVLVAPDFVHPNPAGQAALARLDLAAVQACPS